MYEESWVSALAHHICW